MHINKLSNTHATINNERILKEIVEEFNEFITR